jgi:hypothetical protein
MDEPASEEPVRGDEESVGPVGHEGSHFDRCLSWNRRAANVIPIRCFLELPLDLLGDLQQGVGYRCAGSSDLNDYALHGAGRVFATAETSVRPSARRKQQDYNELKKGTMIYRPCRKIESSPHVEPGSSFTFWPGCKTFTPAMTTTSPSRKPRDMMTADGS